MSLATYRTELADLLTGTGQMIGHDHLPGRITPPVGLVTEGQPYLVPSARKFGAKTVTYHLDLVAETGPNDVTTAQLDQMIEAAVVACEGADWTVTTVGQFFELQHNQARHLAARITTETDITITE